MAKKLNPSELVSFKELLMANKNAEYTAQSASIGMWSLGDKYISPKEWRKTH